MVVLWWLFGSLALINEVTLCGARLVLEWATLSRVQLPVQEISQYITRGWGLMAGTVCVWVAGKTV